MKKRINITMESNLWNEIQIRAERMGMSASALVSYSLYNTCKQLDIAERKMLEMSKSDIVEIYSDLKG